MRKIFQDGISLVEVLIVLSILGLFIGAVISFQTSLFSNNRSIQDSLLAQHEIRSALKKMVSEIRPASPANTGAYPIGIASSTELAFYSDVDQDGLYEYIRYFLTGSTLKRGKTVPSGIPLTYNLADETESVLVQNVVNGPQGLFFYYDEGYTGTENPLSVPINIIDIRLVEISLAVDKDVNRPPGVATSSSQVVIRSLRNNL